MAITTTAKAEESTQSHHHTGAKPKDEAITTTANCNSGGSYGPYNNTYGKPKPSNQADTITKELAEERERAKAHRYHNQQNNGTKAKDKGKERARPRNATYVADPDTHHPIAGGTST
eukprot:5042345-Amphidinium_carterae.2